MALQRLTEQLQQRIWDAGFTDQRMAHHAVFAHIPPEGTTLAQLARSAGMTKQGMSELVADLEAKDYLTRRADEKDKRRKVIELSDRGWAAVRTALGAFEEIERDLERELGAARLTSLRSTLELMTSEAPPASADVRAGDQAAEADGRAGP